MTDETPDPVTQQQLKLAMKAFKKRLKLTRLDAESSLGGGPFSSGRGSGIVGIQPPNQYPREIWEKLVEQGRLRRVGGGLYELAGDPNAPHHDME